MKSPPKLSIITPCFNRAEFISEAIRSVLDQNYPCYEHIIIDGGSTDGTLEKLRQYPHLNVLTSPDNGMYEALNKGLMLAQGEIIGFLNSDDLYTSDVFTDVIKAFQSGASMAVFGGAETFTKDQKDNIKTFEHLIPTNSSLLELATIGSPCFNAWFFKKEVFNTIGIFDASYNIVSDRDFMLRIALADLKYITINRIIYRYRMHSDSMTFAITDKKFDSIIKEHIRLTNYYLDNKDLTNKELSMIKQIPAQNTLGMMVWCLKKGYFHKALKYAFIGMKYDNGWLRKFFQHSTDYIQRVNQTIIS